MPKSLLPGTASKNLVRKEVFPTFFISSPETLELVTGHDIIYSLDSTDHKLNHR